MSNNDRMYKFDEVKILVDYAQSIIFEAVQANLRTNGDHEMFEEISMRMLRRVSRLLI